MDILQPRYPKGMLNSPFCKIDSWETKNTPFMFGVNFKPLLENSQCWFYDGQFFYKRTNINGYLFDAFRLRKLVSSSKESK